MLLSSLPLVLPHCTVMPPALKGWPPAPTPPARTFPVAFTKPPGPESCLLPAHLCWRQFLLLSPPRPRWGTATAESTGVSLDEIRSGPLQERSPKTQWIGRCCVFPLCVMPGLCQSVSWASHTPSPGNASTLMPWCLVTCCVAKRSLRPPLAARGICHTQACVERGPGSRDPMSACAA